MPCGEGGSMLEILVTFCWRCAGSLVMYSDSFVKWKGLIKGDVVAHWCRCCSLMVDMDGGSLV